MPMWPRERLEGRACRAPRLGLRLTEPWVPGQLAGALQAGKLPGYRMGKGRVGCPC